MPFWLPFVCMLAVAFVLGVLVGVFDQRSKTKDVQVDLDSARKLNAHALVSLARKDDEIDLLNARLLAANTELVRLRGDNDVPPEAA